MNVMSTKLKAIPATVLPDGTVVLSEAIELDGPATAVVTIVFETEDAHEPNELTRLVMEEPVEGLPRFATAAELKANLES
jgi:hypothetical protein